MLPRTISPRLTAAEQYHAAAFLRGLSLRLAEESTDANRNTIRLICHDLDTAAADLEALAEGNPDDGEPVLPAVAITA